MPPKHTTALKSIHSAPKGDPASPASEARAVVDARGRVTFASAAFCALFDLSPSDVSGRPFEEVFRIGLPGLENLKTATPGIFTLARKEAASAQNFYMDWMPAADGRPFLVLSPADKNLPSDPVVGQEGALAPLSGDASEPLTRIRRQLSEAESIGHMGHWRWTVGLQDVEWSDGVYRIFGLERGVFQPTLDSVNSLLNRRDAGRLIQVFQRAVIEKNDYDLDFRVTRPDGETRQVRCEGRCEKDPDGEVVALYGIMQDVTERMLHEKQLRDARDAAERAYAAKSQFLATMSHELRTPLNAIIGFSEIMQKQMLGPIGTPRYLEYIDGIRQSGAHLLDLIGDILDMSRIEAGKYTLDLESVDLGAVLERAVGMMRGKAQEARVSLSLTPPPDGTVIRSDRRATTQIVLNLLSNAVKFTPEGGSVHVEGTLMRNAIEIRVTDTGCGIPAHRISSVMRPFEQAHDNLYERKKEGSGLGLAITRELAELHGGSVRIDSEEGRGTTVTVRLPIKARDPRTDKKNDPAQT